MKPLGTKSVRYNLILWSILLLSVALSSNLSAALRSTSKIMPFGEDTAEKLFEKGKKYQDKEQLDSALICYSWLTETYKDSKDKATQMVVGKSLSEMGQLYYVRYNDYSKAYRCLAKAQKIFAEYPDQTEYAKVLLNFGNLFNMYDYIFPQDNGQSLQRSRDYYHKSFQVGVESKNWDMVCSSYINMSMMDIPFKVDGKLNDRMHVLLRDSIPANVADYRLTNLLCDGSTAIAAGDYVKARNLMTMMRDSIGLTAPREKYMATVCLSAVALAEKKYSDAIECIKWILDDNSGINDADVHMEVYDLLSKYSALGGDAGMADYYRMKYYESKDSLVMGLMAIEPTRLGIELDNIEDKARQIGE